MLTAIGIEFIRRRQSQYTDIDTGAVLLYGPGAGGYFLDAVENAKRGTVKFLVW